jgi:uncharacterized protein
MLDSAAGTPPGIHLMAKPAGPACNLRCEYCFYLEKEALFPEGQSHRMSAKVLEGYIRSCAQVNRNDPSGILFAWQGGEPTLMGLDFFHQAVELEILHAAGRPIRNSLQTNGLLLDDRWCEFLAKHRFLVGLSLDGPEAIHDRYRRDARGEPTSAAVLGTLKRLQKHGVEYNVLAAVAHETAGHPLEIYRFFKDQGARFVQFIPIVERLPGESARRRGLSLGLPPELAAGESRSVTPWTVDPQALGDFYAAIFDEWVRNDVGTMFVMNFEWAIHAWCGGPAPVCTMGAQCGSSFIVEHNGDVYACDHYVYPEHRLGNVLADDVRELAKSDALRSWGERKKTRLPPPCRECEFLFACRGGCPKHRFQPAPPGEPASNYLCAGYQRFYRQAKKYLEAFRTLINQGLPCEHIMKAIQDPLVIPTGPEGRFLTLWVR